jgi:hypothetical protein
MSCRGESPTQRINVSASALESTPSQSLATLESDRGFVQLLSFRKMPPARLFTLVSVLAMAISALPTFGRGRLETRGGARRFVSEKYGFSIGVPSGWLVDPSKDTPFYFSFSPSAAGEFNHQLELRNGGAVITVLAQETIPGPHPADLSAWATADARGVSAESPSINPFDMPPAAHVAAAIISSYDSATYGAGDRPEHRVNIFWELRKKRFAAHLMYLAHDPKGSSFTTVYFNTIRSIRPIGRPEQK